MRWVALDVDYEMAGKDLIDSVKLSGEIVRALDGEPPEGFNYELFLDEKGQKISKSKGNGLTIDEWLTYAAPESLALCTCSAPREAKKLYFDVIPRAVDEYLSFLDAFGRQDEKNRLGNPVWHIHGGQPPAPERIGNAGEAGTQISFALLLNLVAVANAEDKAVLWGFLQRYAAGASPETHPRLDALVGYAIRYFRDFVKPKKTYRAADEVEAKALLSLRNKLAALPAVPAPRRSRRRYTMLAVANRATRISRPRARPRNGPGVSNAWFNALYQILLGEERGPRFGSFAAIYGLPGTIALIDKALSGDLIADHTRFLAEKGA